MGGMECVEGRSPGSGHGKEEKEQKFEDSSIPFLLSPHWAA
jgi:hypothetical protein